MNQREEDFRCLVEHACSTLSLPHQVVKEKFIDSPICRMQCRKDSDFGDSVIVFFDRIKATIIISIYEGISLQAAICFYNTKDEDLFIGYLGRSANHYDHRRKLWLVKDYYFLELDEYENGLHFNCYKMEK